MFDKVGKIEALSKKMIENNAENINLYQRLQECSAVEKSQIIATVMDLLKNRRTSSTVVHLDLRNNDLKIADLQSLAQYDGERIEVELDSNYLEIVSEQDAKIWEDISNNPYLNLASGWHQPVRSSSHEKF